MKFSDGFSYYSVLQYGVMKLLDLVLQYEVMELVNWIQLLAIEWISIEEKPAFGWRVANGKQCHSSLIQLSLELRVQKWLSCKLSLNWELKNYAVKQNYWLSTCVGWRVN
jgi:hypothetical protein